MESVSYNPVASFLFPTTNDEAEIMSVIGGLFDILVVIFEVVLVLWDDDLKQPKNSSDGSSMQTQEND